MTLPKNDDFRVDARRVEVAKLYLKGQSQRAIGTALKVSRQTVNNDLKVIRQDWLDTMVEDYHQMQAIQLAKIDYMEAEAWDAWEQSKGNQEVLVEEINVEEKTSMKKSKKPKKTTYTERRDPDTAYLRTVQWCIDKRCEILGLNAPTKVAPTTPDGTQPYQPQLEVGNPVLKLLEDVDRILRETETESTLPPEDPPSLKVLDGPRVA